MDCRLPGRRCVDGLAPHCRHPAPGISGLLVLTVLTGFVGVVLLR